jgi:predicted phage tail protein
MSNPETRYSVIQWSIIAAAGGVGVIFSFALDGLWSIVGAVGAGLLIGGVGQWLLDRASREWF